MDTLYDPGDLVLPGRPVMILYNPSELEVVTFIPADLADAFSPGTEVEIHLPPLDRTLTGRVRNRTDRVDPASRTVEVKLTFDPPSGALPGMYAEVRVSVRNQPALVVPDTAVESLRGLRYVRVITGDNRIDRRLVRPGRELDGRVEILAGLHTGDQVLRVAADLPDSGETE
jgi:RND family efflux transporter MFP subunit